jgi:chaperonin GroES
MSLNLEQIKKIKPLQDRVLVERINEDESKTPGGILIPDQAKEKAQIGIVVSIGNGKFLQNGTTQQMNVKVGDKVFFGKYAGTEISELYIIIREDEILAVL